MLSRQPWVQLTACSALLFSMALRAQTSVPVAPPPEVHAHEFRDGHYGVRFQVPRGWSLARKDKQVSTFHLDARSASPKAQMRSVSAIEFNPYPFSTFSGALFYFSVEPHTTDAECAREATAFLGRTEPISTQAKDVQDIGGMNFAHGHDEHGQICVEARDEVYTAYRKGACYRFDLAMNTFCSISSGAEDMTQGQLQDMTQQMVDILGTVTLAWEKTGPHPVRAPRVPAPPTHIPEGSKAASLRTPGEARIPGS